MAGDIDMGHARALLAVDAASQISAGQPGRRQAPVGARNRKAGDARHGRAGQHRQRARQKEKSGDIVRLEEELSDKLATPVLFKMGAKGRGQMIIDFADLDVLDGVLARLRA